MYKPGRRERQRRRCCTSDLNLHATSAPASEDLERIAACRISLGRPSLRLVETGRVCARPSDGRAEPAVSGFNAEPRKNCPQRVAHSPTFSVHLTSCA